MSLIQNKKKSITRLVIGTISILLLSSLATIYYNPSTLKEQVLVQLITFSIALSLILFLIKKLEKQTRFVQTLLDSQEQLVITTDGELITSVNQSFLDFFEVQNIEEFKTKYKTNTISTTFNRAAPSDYLQRYLKDGSLWIDKIVENTKNHKVTKVMISKHNEDYIFSVDGDELPSSQGLKSAIFTDITEMEATKHNLEEIHKNIRDSIEYASLIQGSLIPKESMFEHFFKDYFIYWSPKDTVGGDIYLFETLRHEDEALLLYIDCTGHGVPGAFVTMIVKAIEREVVAKIKKDPDMDVSAAWIMKYFNKTMKILLLQEQGSSISNTGFDGGIIYYNKREKILKFSGAQIPLFYVNAQGEYIMLKGNRYSVGYTQCDTNYDYKETIIPIEKGMKFYCTTDGYIDQNGGEKDFPFGKKSFGNIIKQNHTKQMSEQKKIFIETMYKHESMVTDNERNDDITVIGFEI